MRLGIGTGIDTRTGCDRAAVLRDIAAHSKILARRSRKGAAVLREGTGQIGGKGRAIRLEGDRAGCLRDVRHVELVDGEVRRNGGGRLGVDDGDVVGRSLYFRYGVARIGLVERDVALDVKREHVRSHLGRREVHFLNILADERELRRRVVALERDVLECMVGRIGIGRVNRLEGRVAGDRKAVDGQSRALGLEGDRAGRLACRAADGADVVEGVECRNRDVVGVERKSGGDDLGLGAVFRVLAHVAANGERGGLDQGVVIVLAQRASHLDRVVGCVGAVHAAEDGGVANAIAGSLGERAVDRHRLARVGLDRALGLRDVALDGEVAGGTDRAVGLVDLGDGKRVDREVVSDLDNRSRVLVDNLNRVGVALDGVDVVGTADERSGSRSDELHRCGGDADARSIFLCRVAFEGKRAGTDINLACGRLRKSAVDRDIAILDLAGQLAVILVEVAAYLSRLDSTLSIDDEIFCDLGRLQRNTGLHTSLLNLRVDIASYLDSTGLVINDAVAGVGDQVAGDIQILADNEFAGGRSFGGAGLEVACGVGRIGLDDKIVRELTHEVSGICYATVRHRNSSSCHAVDDNRVAGRQLGVSVYHGGTGRITDRNLRSSEEVLPSRDGRAVMYRHSTSSSYVV